MADDARPQTPAQPCASALPLRLRVARAAGWYVGCRVVVGGLTAAKFVVLARLLEPADFGLFAMVMAAVVLVRTLTHTGFRSALIQRPAEAGPYFDTAWTTQVVRGAVRGGLLFGTAPLVAGFFREPLLVPLLRAMCGAALVTGFVHVGVLRFRKDLRFDREFVYELPPALAGLATGVLVALHAPSAWALVWAALAAAVARCAASHAMVRSRLRFRIDAGQLLELLRFGRWLLGSAVVGYAITRGPPAFLGRVLGASALGLYAVAVRLTHGMADSASTMVRAVMLPGYAEVQADRERTARAFAATFQLAAYCAGPLAAFVVFSGHDLVVGLLGAQWLSATLPAQLLAGAGCLSVVMATARPAFVGVGRPRAQFVVGCARLAAMAAVIYPLARAQGVPGVAASVLVGALAALPVWVGFVVQLGVRPGVLLADTGIALLLALCAATGVGVARLLPPGGGAALLAWQAACAGGLWALGAYACERWLRPGPISQLRELVSAVRSARRAARR